MCDRFRGFATGVGFTLWLASWCYILDNLPPNGTSLPITVSLLSLFGLFCWFWGPLLALLNALFGDHA